MTLQGAVQIPGVFPLLRGRPAEGPRHALRSRASRIICATCRAIRRLRPALRERMVDDALKLCRALGYDLNTVEFAVEDGIPYAIDFMNPAPDAGLESVGPENFEWMVDARGAKWPWRGRLRAAAKRCLTTGQLAGAGSLAKGGINERSSNATQPDHRDRRGISDRRSRDARSALAHRRRDHAEGQDAAGGARQAGNAPVGGRDRHRRLHEHSGGQGRDPRYPPADRHAGARRTDCASPPAARILSPIGRTRRSIPTTATASSWRT